MGKFLSKPFMLKISQPNFIANIARIVPNGILVCFASYALMQKCFDIWNINSSPADSEGQSSGSIYKRLISIKPIYKEPKRSSELDNVMANYKRDAASKGAILCCVCKGKISEGIDFNDDMARGVVLVGIPFPSLADIK